jgi:CO/xanthine dehydrogenase FAD-binding subunit
MKPSVFKYFDPTSVDEAIGLLQRYGEDAKILAGGQSLVPMMNFRVARPKVLVDINKVQGLSYIREEGEEIAIGALTREREVERATLVREKCPILSEAVSHIGHLPVRTRGTIGGSLVHADPSAEIPTVICALGGSMKAVGPSGERSLGPEEFFLTYLTSALGPDEILTEVRVPVLPPGTGWSFLELSRRHGDFAIVAVASIVGLDGDGRCNRAAIALGGVAPTPIRAREAEEALLGRALEGALLEEAGRLGAEATEPESDYHASADYRRDMARVFVRRGLEEAIERAKGGR